MYFPTLTEVPILQGLIDNGRGKKSTLALLLAGMALSLPNLLVIRSAMGPGKRLFLSRCWCSCPPSPGYYMEHFFKR